VLRNLGGRADAVLIGGKMAEQLRVENPLDFDVELPSDVVGAAAFEADAKAGVYAVDDLPSGWLGLDIGPETRAAFAERLAAAKTIFWNGPMGVFEWSRFAACVETGLRTFAQNVHWASEGAFTGEISPPMLLALGVRGSLVGHSERRQYFGETDDGVARRTHAALEAGLEVIACVGETLAQREAGETEDVLRRQVSVLEAHPRLVLAYEPVWAIGTGLTATPEQAQEAHAFIRSLLDVPVLYGGSVKPDNAEGLLS